MKTILHLCISLLLTLFVISCSEDDQINKPENKPAYTVILFGKEFTISENGGPQEIIIPFSGESRFSGEIVIKLTTDEGVVIQTTPEMIDGLISLQVNEGDSNVSFIITPANDELISGFHNLIFSIEELSENFRTVNNRNLVVGLLDDELNGMPRAYEATYGYGSVREEYFYNTEKQLIKIQRDYIGDWSWTEIENFFYSEDSRLMKSNLYYNELDIPSTKTLYYWESDKIIKADINYDSSWYSYILYDYDENGNIKTKSVYNTLEENSEDYILTSSTNYQINSTGNLLEEKISYYNGNASNQYLITTYDHYTDKINYFPKNEILPGMMVQKNLPGSISIEENGTKTTYSFTYNFDEEGRVIQQKMGNKTVLYSYH